MRQYKESEWREEVKDLENMMSSDSFKGPNPAPWWAIAHATTRGAVLHFFLGEQEDINTDTENIMAVRKRLKKIQRVRRGKRKYKRYLWRRSLKAKIYRWQFKCEYKRITKHDKPNNTIDQ